MSFRGHTVEPSAGSTATLEDARSHLFNDRTVERYRESLRAGVETVAAKVSTTTRPFTGTTPDRLAPEISGIDLDRPLGDLAEALAELEDVYLRDAVYFHH